MDDLSGPLVTPASRAETALETAFQAYTRSLNLTFQAAVASPLPLAPVIDEMHALMASTPDGARGHMTVDGSWSDITLLLATATGTPGPTAAYDACPAFAALLAALGGPAGIAVLARIPPGDLLDWHHDPVSADGETLRLHLPIATDPAAVTEFCHERVHWPAGGLYYGDYGFPHRVFNTGTRDRIHLYFDVLAGNVRERLPEALASPRHTARQEAVSLWSQWRQSP